MTQRFPEIPWVPCTAAAQLPKNIGEFLQKQSKAQQSETKAPNWHAPLYKQARGMLNICTLRPSV